MAERKAVALVVEKAGKREFLMVGWLVAPLDPQKAAKTAVHISMQKFAHKK